MEHFQKKHSAGFEIETERLALSEMSHRDFPELCDMLQNPVVMLAWERTLTDEEIRDWIDRNLSRYREFGYGYWLLTQKQSGEIIGQVGLLPETICGKRHLGVGWILHRSHWGKGYATEAAKGCIDYAFRTLDAERIVAAIRPDNTPSIRVAERLAMMPCGEYNKPVDGKIMPHEIFYLRTPRVTVTDYNPVWPEQFQKLCFHLTPLFHTFGGELEHIGSTSVPGLTAKPVIDADYILPSPSLWPKVKKELETLGFFHRGDGGLPGREMFTESLKLDFRHNFYVCRANSPHLENHRKLRDFLRTHPTEAAEYGELKQKLARSYPDQVDSYCAGKSELLARFLTRAGFDSNTVETIKAINKSFGSA